MKNLAKIAMFEVGGFSRFKVWPIK